MTYVKTLWKPRGDAAETLFTSARMNNIETGVKDAHDAGAAPVVLRAQRNADVPLGAGYHGPLGIDEIFDSHNIYDGQKFQPNDGVTRWYRFSATLSFSGMSAANPMEVYLVKNFSTSDGSPSAGTVLDNDMGAARSDGWGVLKLGAMCSLNGSTDFVCVYCWLGGTGGSLRGTSQQAITTFHAEIVGSKL